LTQEEKQCLLAEGLPVPTTLPLTKREEEALKGVRKKLRNKVCNINHEKIFFNTVTLTVCSPSKPKA